MDFLTIFGKQHQHAFKNDMHVQLSLTRHFYLLYFLLNSCDGNDAFWRHCMLVKQSSSSNRKHRTLFVQVYVFQTVRLTTQFLDWCRNVCKLYKHGLKTPVRDTSRCDQRLEAVPHWHVSKHITKRQRRSSWSMENYVQTWMQNDITLNSC